MTTFEWLSIIITIAAGFVALLKKLAAIEVALVGKVSYKDCHEKRDNCPCVNEIKEIKRRLEK
ncbi:MAG: hypothetical protein MJ016_02160 [Victivallaceae bacterium]|nr:hypothetical protein [Victivallaceae bacterium]